MFKMIIKMHVTGLKRINRMAINLPANLGKDISKASLMFMNNVKKSAKLKAPRDTGALAESIIVTPTKIKGLSSQFKLVVGSYYGIFQEEGFRPHRFFADQTINSSKLAPGKFYFVSKFKPFVAPALEINIAKLPSILSNATKRAIKTSAK